MADKKKNPFQDTLNLPKTEFSIRANSAIKEPEILDRWAKEDIYSKTYNENRGSDKFILHDGPPYANGNIHLGHAFNKSLKDVVAKFWRMYGFYVPVKPGWDCHGLPIELNAIKSLEKKLNTIENKEDRSYLIKKTCRYTANKWIEIQKKEFKELGVFMDWDNPYITMSPEYESDILYALSKFIEDGYIERKGKTVPWCASCQTVLATAEIEYKERKDPSIYVLFPFDKEISEKLFPGYKNLEVNLLIWTTTPWTLPLNRAVILNKNAKYVLLKAGDNKAFVVAKDLVDKICKTLEIEKHILVEFDSKIFEHQKVNHPFINNLKVPVILDDSVLLDEGTACVHSAPGCGPEDYVIGVKNGLEIFSPISPSGKYIKGIEPKELQGLSVQDGQIWVLKRLKEKGQLLHKTSIMHSYPHCWRCHNPLIFRATKQWFCDLQKNDLTKKALKQIDKINFYPERSKARLYSFVSNRTEWCISRQRVWGVPIPALICKKCKEAYLNADFVKKVARYIAKDGIEFWDTVSLEKLKELQILPNNFKCKKCENLNDFEKERDTLDVWFDSGISNFAVLEKYKKQLGFPADLYLEASDQHRGWFQSSLLCSMVLQDATPTRAILTHGFTVDDKGQKMSKSLGNVISPNNIIKNFSRDTLRLWVVATDYTNDLAISPTIFSNLSHAYRKIRNTCRFMISNLYDFDIKEDAISFEQLLMLDKFALANLFQLNTKIIQNYKNYNFVNVFQLLNSYCVNDLSAFYLDVCKDRLYTEKANSFLRRSAQTVIFYVLDTITRLMAPFLPFLSEEVSDFYQKNKDKSIHLQFFNKVPDIWELSKDKKKTYVEKALQAYLVSTQSNITYPVYMNNIFNILKILRDIVLKSIELKRENNLIKHSLESKIIIYLDPEVEQTKLLNSFIKELQETEDKNRFFKDLFIVSQFNFANSPEGLDKTDIPWIFVKVEHAQGNKCPRCWQWDITDNKEHLCKRCQKVLS